MCAALACYNWIAYEQKGVDMVCVSECLIVNLNFTPDSGFLMAGVRDRTTRKYRKGEKRGVERM